MKAAGLEALNVMQQVLRLYTISLIGSATVDISKLAALLQSSAAAPNLEPQARAILNDLATGLDVMTRAGRTPN